ncbi:hypothetical protein ACKVMT_09915 [Halobacteriales archaeon Cl-PHB]
MTREPDPRNLDPNWRPAEVDVAQRDGCTLVADARILDTGWLRTMDWEGRRILFPPWQVISVERLETEADPENEHPGGPIRLADDSLRAYVAEITTERDTPTREVPADA